MVRNGFSEFTIQASYDIQISACNIKEISNLFFIFIFSSGVFAGFICLLEMGGLLNSELVGGGCYAQEGYLHLLLGGYNILVWGKR